MLTENRVGRVVGLWRYPVKGMSEEALSHAEVSWHGLIGDRRWAFVQEAKLGHVFPWFTLRERSDLQQYRPAFVDPTRPDTSVTRVFTPSGRTLDVTDRELALELSPEPLQLIRYARGVFDTFPLSIITTQTLASLSHQVGVQLDVQRFRPNLLIRANTEFAYPEDEWVGRVLRVGSLRVRVDKRDGRCVVITIDPNDQRRTPEILRTVAQHRDGCLGVYGTTVEPGRVVLDDAVVLES